MLIRASGKANVEWFPKTASTAFKNGNVVILTSGQLVPATATSLQLVGTILKDIVSTDSDYASTTLVPVDVPTSADTFLADVKVGVTAAATGVGAQCDLFIGTGSGGMPTGEMYVDTGTNSHHQVTIVGFVSATQVLVKLNALGTTLPAA